MGSVEATSTSTSTHLPALVGIAEGLAEPLAVLTAKGSLEWGNSRAMSLLSDSAELSRQLASLCRDTVVLGGRRSVRLLIDCSDHTVVWSGYAWPIDDHHVALVLQTCSHAPSVGLVARCLRVECPEARLALRVAQGHSNRNIASRLGIGVNAMNMRLFRLYRKLRVRNRAQLASLVADSVGRTVTS